MKKILFVLIGALLVFAIPFTAFADDDANANGNSTFDHTVFSSLDYYSEDKFDKTWSVLGAPSKDSMNGTFAISVTGTSDNAITNVTIVFTENTAANLLRYNINYAKILFDDGRVINFVFPPVLKQYFIDNSTIPMYFCNCSVHP